MSSILASPTPAVETTNIPTTKGAGQLLLFPSQAEITVRDFAPEDATYINDKMVDISGPLFIAKRTALVDGVVVGVAHVKLEAYTSVHLNQGLKPEVASKAFAALTNATVDECYTQGLDECVLWADSTYAKSHKLTQLGWGSVPASFTCFWKRLINKQ
jgi:hypothetical protein